MAIKNYLPQFTYIKRKNMILGLLYAGTLSTPQGVWKSGRELIVVYYPY